MAELSEHRDRADHHEATVAGSSLVWPIGLVCLVIAVFVNVGLFETAEAAGVSFRLRGKPDVFITFQELTTGWRTVDVRNVLINTTAPFLIGLALFSVALRRSWGAAAAVIVAGVTLAVATTIVPLSLERTAAEARDLLIRMHLITGALFAASVMPALIVRARSLR